MAEMLDRLARVAHACQFCAGLNPAQWEALRYLSRANRYSRTPGALASYLGATPGTISQTVIALEEKGYVTRSRASSDRRSVEVRLTAAGEEVLRHDPLAMLTEAMDGLSADERQALGRAVDWVIERINTARGVVGFGLCRDCTHLRQPENGANKSCRCGVTGEGLAVMELGQICVDFRR
jgi:DNA-binding MarR family transcriptional regulator